MSVKTTVGNFVAFLESLPESLYYEEEWITLAETGEEVEELSSLPPFTPIKVAGGVMREHDDMTREKDLDLEREFRKWKKNQDIAIVGVKIKKEFLSELKIFARDRGGRIIE